MTATKLVLVFRVMAIVAVIISGVWAQSTSVTPTSNLPLCVAAGFQQAFPAGPAVNVTDVDFAYSTMVTPPLSSGDPFVFPHSFRAVAPAESVAFKGTFLDATTMQVLVQGRLLPLTQTFTNPVEIGAGTRVVFSMPSDIVADADGTITIAVIGLLAPAGACRAYNSPMKLTLAAVADGVYGYPVDADHPLMSGYVSVFGADDTTTIVVGGHPLDVALFGRIAIARSLINGTGEVRQGGALIVTFPVQGQLTPKPAANAEK